MTDSPGPRISLAQWSLHRSIQGGSMRGLDTPRIAREQFGIEAVELVNTLLERSDGSALRSLRRDAEDSGVRILVVMVDDEGDLSSPDHPARQLAVENHRRWIEKAAVLGCHALRVNTGAEGRVSWNQPLTDPAVQTALGACAESCAALCEAARPHHLRVLVENHGGLSSNIPAVIELVDRVADPLFGTLPDFGNFAPAADPYESVERLMPHAAAVSAKCYDFDGDGLETRLDFPRLLDIVLGAGYRGHLGIEYEGERLSEPEGIRAAARLISRLLAERREDN